MKRFSFKQVILAYSTVFLLMFGFLHAANSLSLEEIQQAIEGKGAKWTAGETSVSGLSLEEMKRLAGTILSGEEHEGDAAGPTQLPSAFDWRNNGGNWVTPVRDQANCGSCWAFGTVGAMESLKMITDGSPDPTLDLSEQFFVSCNMANSGCGGGYMDRAYNFAKWVGTGPESCCPYKARDLPCLMCFRCLNRSARVKIDSWSWVSRDVNAMKEAIYENPITVAFYLYADFYSYTGGVYEHVTGSQVGGHAVLAVGWDDNPPEGPNKACFIVKNSWGSGWGESGYFRIAYTQVDNEVRFGTDSGDFEMGTGSLAPPMAASRETAATVWGKIKNSR